MLAILPLVYSQASAQYFGRNKVRYHSFDFRYLSTEHYDIYYYSGEKDEAEDLGRMAERWYARYTNLFDHHFEKRKPIVLYANGLDFQQTNIIPELLGEGTGGVTEPLKDRVVMPLAGSYGETDHVIGHEMVHVFQFDLAQGPKDSTQVHLDRLPTWFIEGMAEYLSIGRDDPNSTMWMRDAVIQDKFPTIKQLNDASKYFPYRYGQALWAYIAGVWGDQAVPALLSAAGNAGLEEGCRRVLGVHPDSLSKMWRQATKDKELAVAKGRKSLDDSGDKIIAGEQGSGLMYLAPEISPDGRYVAFLSEKGIFAIDLYLADVSTGKIIKRLTSTASNGHMDALRFVDSAGSWSPDGKEFAFIVSHDGYNEIAVLDVKSRDVERWIRIPDVGSLSNPTWSPDGKSLVVSGSTGGSDLYFYDFKSREVRRLTNGPYANLHPSWSPDGKTIAFATDRGEGNTGTDVSQLRYGNLKIGLYDLATGDIRLLNPFPGAKHINPQYSPDGRNLYFISDRDGVSDIYRMNLDGGDVRRVTNVKTGVSGIAADSPALSVARDTGELAFSVFSEGNYLVLGLGAAKAEGAPVAEDSTSVAGVLAPVHPSPRVLVTTYLADAHTGLVPGPFQEHSYTSALHLDYVGVPYAGVAVDQYGAGVVGGIGLNFSDMLENRELALAVQSNGGIKDLGGEVDYQNNRSRWTWGGSISHIPYLTVSDLVGTDASNGYPVYSELQEREYIDQATVMSEYPFSTSRRAELGLGYTRVSFSLQEEDVELNPSGEINFDNTYNPGSLPALSLFNPYAAYVFDNSFEGFCSPVKGQRYRLEVQPNWGSLNYESIVIDYRKYFFANPVTIAFRGVHYGRYGSDAESDLLTPLFVGYPSLVRGYDLNSFDLTPYTSTDPAFERLTGTRMIVANFETRLAVVGDQRLGVFRFPAVPIELVGFADMGAAWSRSSPIKWAFERSTTDRVPVFSAGASLRINVLGAVVVEGYAAYPFQRPGAGTQLGLQLAQGW